MKGTVLHLLDDDTATAVLLRNVRHVATGIERQCNWRGRVRLRGKGPGRLTPACEEVLTSITRSRVLHVCVLST